jgi:hypothetical protein
VVGPGSRAGAEQPGRISETGRTKPNLRTDGNSGAGTKTRAYPVAALSAGANPGTNGKITLGAEAGGRAQDRLQARKGLNKPKRELTNAGYLSKAAISLGRHPNRGRKSRARNSI